MGLNIDNIKEGDILTFYNGKPVEVLLILSDAGNDSVDGFRAEIGGIITSFYKHQCEHLFITPDNGVYKRTFEAKNHPQGSKERKKLNSCGITSEYRTSHKYQAIGHGYSLSFKTKKQAQEFFNKH